MPAFVPEAASAETTSEYCDDGVAPRRHRGDGDAASMAWNLDAIAQTPGRADADEEAVDGRVHQDREDHGRRVRGRPRGDGGGPGFGHGLVTLAGARVHAAQLLHHANLAPGLAQRLAARELALRRRVLVPRVVVPVVVVVIIITFAELADHQKEHDAQGEPDGDAHDVAERGLGLRDHRDELHGHGAEHDARRQVLHRRHEQNGRLRDSYRKPENDHGDAGAAHQGHVVAEALVHGGFLDVHVSCSRELRGV